MSLLKIIHIIPSLGVGGAEKVLFDIITHSDPMHYEHIVISLQGLDYYGVKLIEYGIKVHCLNIQKQPLRTVAKFYRILKIEKPQIVCGWLYHGNLFSSLAKIFGFNNIIWNIHNTFLPWKTSSKRTIIVNKICGLFSYFVPKSIIYCAAKALKVHCEQGYRQSIGVVIRNGYDTVKFSPSDDVREKFRNLLSIVEDQVLIGCVGRYDSAKDQDNLLRALFLLSKNHPDINFKCLFIGNGIIKNLSASVRSYRLSDKVILKDNVDDIENYYNALDIHVLSSLSEACPNVVAESMACGVINVATDVGDVSHLLAEPKFMVPIKDPYELYKMILRVILLSNEDKHIVSDKVVSKIHSDFSINKMILNYCGQYKEVARTIV